MGIERSIRRLQDKARNTGWRIQWIPWQETGRPEYVYNTPLTLVTGFGGAAVFLLSIGAILLGKYRPEISPVHTEADVVKTIIVGVAGLVIIILGRIYASFHKQAGWKPVTAQVLDQEIQECVDADERGSYEFRLLCRFRYRGKNYDVTPETSRMMSFTSERRAHKYLDERISAGNTCRLWIDPRNPLHAVFHKKQKI